MVFCGRKVNRVVTKGSMVRNETSRNPAVVTDCAVQPGSVPISTDGQANRRRDTDRRRFSIRSLVYGGVKPRRRASRRGSDENRGFLDWHDSNLLYASILILLFSSADAVLTLNLIHAGAAEEFNVFMGKLIETNVYLFTATKMFLTGTGLVVLVVLARFCVFRVIKVGHIIALTLMAYLVLIAYELMLLTTIT